VLERKQIVKFGISLSLFSLFGVNLYNSMTKESKRHAKTDKAQETLVQSQIAEKKRTSLQKKKCTELKNTIELKLKNKLITKSWSNYHLSKDGLDYILRIEKDNNQQGIEVNRVKFYKLDNDGFPTAFSKNHNIILKDSGHLESLKKGYTIIQKDDVFLSDHLLIEKTNGKVREIKDQRSSELCSFSDHT
jgi:hypothetical protein